MIVRNLVSWAGHDFSYGPGDLIDLPDDIAQARIDAALAEAVPDTATPPKGRTAKADA